MWEGEYEFYVVQFRSPGYPTRNKPEWCDFDCTSGLFHGLTYEQKNGVTLPGSVPDRHQSVRLTH